MSEIINEKRRERRVEEFNDITMSVISGEKNFLKRKVFYDCSGNISVSGARIYSDSYFPIDTLLKMDIKFENTRQMVTVTGKVKWFKTIFDDEWYEGGIEFVNIPYEMRKKLTNHIISLLCSNSEDFDYSYIT